MLKNSPIHREGFVSLLVFLTIGVLVWFIFAFFFQDYDLLNLVIRLAILAKFIIVLQFFRNPDRKVASPTANTLLAPADGKVVTIEEVEETEYFKGKRLMVSIFMSPFNVHVNRISFNGEVSYVQYHPGKYLMAWDPKSSTENERNTVVLDNGRHEVLFRQIAGFLARRIVCYAKRGLKVTQGDEMGFIKFGSRVDIFLPLGTEVKVSVGQKVTGNRTLIADI